MFNGLSRQSILIVDFFRWRVTEISQIILVLLDSRCPLLHYPPSLSTYLSHKKHILVLTKVDIAGPERVAVWTTYLHAKHPTMRIIHVESFAERDVSAVHQGRMRHDPHLPDAFRHRFVQTLQEVHAELLEPPEEVKTNPNRLKNWRPRIKTDIDWDAVHNARGENVGTVVGGAIAPVEGEEDAEPQFLSIGLVGERLTSFQSIDSTFLIITRTTQCGKVLAIERSVRHSQGPSVQNSGKDETFSDAILDLRGPPRRLSRACHAKLRADGDAGSIGYPSHRAHFVDTILYTLR